MRVKTVSCCLAFPLLVSIACKDGDGSKSGSADPDDGAAPGTYLGLSPLSGTEGFQLRSHGMTIAPGQDIEHCELAEVPGSESDTYYVREIEYGNELQSHHLQLFSFEPGSDADLKIRGLALGEPVPCRFPEAAYGVGAEFIGGSQRPYAKRAYPAGVARKLRGGQRLVFDYHYYNTTEEPIEARSAANFHLTDAASVAHNPQEFAFINWTIDIPAGEKRSFTAECKFSQDTMLARLERHTHRWGTDFTAWYLGGPNDGREIYASHSFDEDLADAFPEPILVKAGEGFQYRCDFDNTENRPLRFGLNATDEMCNLVMEGWGATDEVFNGQGCDINHIDPDGIGRTGFGNPPAAEVDQCLQESTESPTCAQCVCPGCGGLLVECNAVPDCKAMTECMHSSRDNLTSFDVACADVITAHASAYGMAMRVRACTYYCADACIPAPPDAGAADGG